MKENISQVDHPIFLKSIEFIKDHIGVTGLEPLEQAVLERLIHSSGDFSLQPLLRFSPGACERGISAIREGAVILTDTQMAAAAIRPMAQRTLNNTVKCILDWAPATVDSKQTRTSIGLDLAWKEISRNCDQSQAPIVLIGSAPKALDRLLDLIEVDKLVPSLIIGMPVGFIGVLDSKKRLAESQFPQIRLNGNRGGAGLAAATVNALLRSTIDPIYS